MTLEQADKVEAELRRRLAANVRRLRNAKGLTLKQAGERAEVHWRHWQKVEAGDSNATVFTMTRLADVLDVDPSDLLRAPPPQAQQRS